MSVKVHEPVCVDSAQDLYFWFDHFLGDQLKDEWRAVGTGSAVVIDQQTGGIVRIITGAINGNAYFIDWNNIRSLLVSKKATMEFRLKLTQTTLTTMNHRLFFDNNNCLGFYYDTALGHSNWQIQCVDGGVSTTLDSGIAVDTSYHIFRIEAFPTGQVHFYIDGVETGGSPITTNIPDDATDYLEPHFRVKTNENATKSVDLDYVVMRQER